MLSSTGLCLSILESLGQRCGLGTNELEAGVELKCTSQNREWGVQKENKNTGGGEGIMGRSLGEKTLPEQFRSGQGQGGEEK
jgi:hypothetical protein